MHQIMHTIAGYFFGTLKKNLAKLHFAVVCRPNKVYMHAECYSQPELTQATQTYQSRL
jgi:hypothetical protein